MNSCKMTEQQLQLEWQDFSLSGQVQLPAEFKNNCIATYKVAAPHETVHHVLVEKTHHHYTVHLCSYKHPPDFQGENIAAYNNIFEI